MVARKLAPPQRPVPAAFRLREGLLEGLWIIPLAAAVLGAVLGIVLSLVDEEIGAPSLRRYSPSTASAVLTSIVGATAALTGFVVTVTVLVVQTATGTFSARIPRLWVRDGMLKATLAVLVGDTWGNSVDLDRASGADRQGIGGPAHGSESGR